MQLMTKALEKRFEALGTQDGDGAIVVTSFFDPCGSWTWYATEWLPDHCEGGAFFGLVDGLESELGYFALAELAAYRGPLGLGIERDLYWHEKPLSDVQAEVDSRRRAS